MVTSRFPKDQRVFTPTRKQSRRVNLRLTTLTDNEIDDDEIFDASIDPPTNYEEKSSFDRFCFSRQRSNLNI
jgi:hypothetical protein